MVSKRHTDQTLLAEPADDGRILLAARPDCSVSYVKPNITLFKVQMRQPARLENLAYLKGEGHRWSTCQDPALCPYDPSGISIQAFGQSCQPNALDDDGDTMQGALDLALLSFLVETACSINR